MAEAVKIARAAQPDLKLEGAMTSPLALHPRNGNEPLQMPGKLCFIQHASFQNAVMSAAQSSARSSAPHAERIRTNEALLDIATALMMQHLCLASGLKHGLFRKQHPTPIALEEVEWT